MTRALVGTWLVVAVLLLGHVSVSAGPNAQPNVREAFIATQFQQVDVFGELPESVRSNLLAHFALREPPERRIYIADPGRPFSAGDALLPGPRLPMRRLKFGGIAPSLVFVYYEHGGRGHHYHLTIYTTSASEPVFAGRLTPGFKDGHVGEEPSAIEMLKEWLRGGRITNDAIENNDW